MNTCETCRFYVEAGKSIGDCCRNPPTVMPFKWSDHDDAESSGDTILMHTVFPVVHVWGWCGQWSGKHIAAE